MQFKVQFAILCAISHALLSEKVLLSLVLLKIDLAGESKAANSCSNDLPFHLKLVAHQDISIASNRFRNLLIS